MTIAIIVAVCIVLLVLAFLLPRLSIWPQRGVDRTLGVGQRAGGEGTGADRQAVLEVVRDLAEGHEQERLDRPQGARQDAALAGLVGVLGAVRVAFVRLGAAG